MQLTFMGAVQTVTGSKYLITTEHQKILVDCGLFQGLKELRSRNWLPLPVNPREIDAVVLTHAHIDHTGYIPLLVKNGFAGKIYCSFATKDLCNILLPDSGYLQEEEAKFANKHGYSRHKPALPLYTKEDAELSLQYFKPVDFEESLQFKDDVVITLHRAGHILGASLVEIKQNGKNLVFSGDLGRMHDVIMPPPTMIQSADYLILESTYGDRLHEPTDPMIQLAEIVNRTVKRGGSIIIPAFAVGRAQMILYFLYQLKKAKKIPDIPVFLDSPMAVSATKLLCQYSHEHTMKVGDCQKACDATVYVNTPEESKELDAHVVPIIIISASGMAEGGRVLHHLKVFLPDARNTILFAGYQATGTRGAAMIGGKKEIKIHGEDFPVKAEVIALTNMSAHADYEEILTWLSHFKKPPRKIFLTHGELSSSEALKKMIKEKFGWNCIIPQYLQKETLL